MTPKLHAVFVAEICGETVAFDESSWAEMVPLKASAPAPNAALLMNSLLFTLGDFNSSISLSCDMAFHLRDDVASLGVVLFTFLMWIYIHGQLRSVDWSEAGLE
jgi:hypothetical protein